MSMRKPHGNFLMFDPDPASGNPATVEMDSFTCMHCTSWNRIPPGYGPTDEYVDPKTGRKRLLGATCKCCNENEYICARCKERGGCVPIDMACEIIEGPIRKLEATIKQHEDRGRFLREVFGIT